MLQSYWKEIRNSNVETSFNAKIDGAIRKLVTINAWKTGSDSEEGKVIAHVVLTAYGDVCTIYADNIAKTDAYAQEFIQEAMATIKDKYTIWIDDETRDDGTFDVMVHDDSAEETDYCLGRGHIATHEQAEEILQDIIKRNPHLQFMRLPTKMK